MLAIILTLVMTFSMMLVFTVSGSAEETEGVYTLNVDDLIPFPNGARYDGQYEKVGTNDYFTVIYSEKTKIESSSTKSFSDGHSSSQRISWGAKTEIGDQILNAVKFTAKGSASIKVWWVGGDPNRQVAIFDANGNVIDATKAADTIKNDPFIAEFEVPTAGVYYIGNLGGSNYFHMIQVTDSGYGEPDPTRGAWSGVAAPSISSAADNGDGDIVVKVNGLVGVDGADELLVSMYNSKGDLVITKGSITEKAAHTFVFTPADSGNYSFKARLVRAGETDKESSSLNADFQYVLVAPGISSVTSMGGGKIKIQWNSVHEAESYIIYQDDVVLATVNADTLSYVSDGLTIGKEYSYVVAAVRGNEELRSGKASTIATAEEKRTWQFAAYGPSTNEDNNGYEGSVNDDGQVTVFSEGGKGKIQPDKHDGLAFYYTAIPTEYNFTLRARVSIDKWTLSNGQEGFGLMVTDRVGENGDKGDVWNNSYLAGSTKIEYKYNSDTDEVIDIKVVDSSLMKFSMKMGIGVVSRTGVTQENLRLIEGKGDPEKGEMTSSQAIGEYFVARNYTLDRTAADIAPDAGTYNVIGNYTSVPAGSFEERFLITEYIMEIQKNNSGYFIKYFDKDGNFISEKKFYDPEALNHLDPDYVYAGFFASRNARATFSDIELTTILASEDDPREYPDVTKIKPTVTVNSGSATTSKNYELIVDVNVAGNLTVKYGNETIVTDEYLEAEGRFRKNIELSKYGENPIYVEFTPDGEQELPEFTELSSTSTIYVTHSLMYNRGNYHRKTIYISPDVEPYTTTANGTKENPFDIFTAVENAYPGQTLILMEGTYKMPSALKIQRGMDGTAENPIRLIADPEATTRPVLDFQKEFAGLTHAGDYWYFYGFDVTGSSDMQKGFQVSGNYNVLDQINAYENGNTGIQLSRLSGSDLFEDWPSYNLILNCTSYRNYDSGFEDADGFAAKLTVGEGNVFDGCIAYNNADDGWDLYAKVESGPIGSVTIRNCISYENGFVPGAGSKTGNGNGFKMGGESISGKHVLENSIAFNNLMKGIDSNSCPDIIVKNSIAFNNGSHNVALYTNSAENTAFVANGIISFRTDKLEVAENLKGKGNQVAGDYINNTTYYWNENKGYCANLAGVQITADMFVSLEFTGWSRNADGTINLNGFLEIKDNIPENASGCKLGGMASYEIILEADEKCTYSSVWYNVNKDAHWHLCECGNKGDVAAHEYIWMIDKPQVDDQTGLKHQECSICGYKKSAITIYPEVEPIVPEEPVVQLNFFQRIWQAILNFFRNLFGIKPKN